LILSLAVLINPIVRVLGTEMATHREGCLSIAGYSAHVTRPLTILVSSSRPGLYIY